MECYGIVLGGGGAKGGYEIGVWKALRELNISICAVAGTSVGALNGALIVQDDFDRAYDLWTSLSMEDVIKVEKEVATSEDSIKKHLGILTAIRNTINAGGLDVTPLKQLIEEVMDEEKIRESKVDFGLVTFSLSDFKPQHLFKEDIPNGELGEYLLASACFPAFKPQEIGNKKFIDGGVYDNIPVSLMVKKGIKNIILVDVSGPGVVRRIDKKGLNIIEIKNSEDLGGTLDFDGERSKINIILGYLDTLKAFKKLKGTRYFILPSDEYREASEEYIKSLGIDDFKKMYTFLGMEWGSKTPSHNRFILDRIMRTIQQYAGDKLSSESIFPAMAEIAAEQLGIDRRRAYSLNELVDEVIKEYENIKNSSDFDDYVKGLTKLVTSRNQLEFDREIKRNLIEGKFLISYEPYVNNADVNLKRFRRFIALAFPKISIANMFISLVLHKNKKEATNEVED